MLMIIYMYHAHDNLYFGFTYICEETSQIYVNPEINQ